MLGFKFFKIFLSSCASPGISLVLVLVYFRGCVVIPIVILGVVQTLFFVVFWKWEPF